MKLAFAVVLLCVGWCSAASQQLPRAPVYQRSQVSSTGAVPPTPPSVNPSTVTPVAEARESVVAQEQQHGSPSMPQPSAVNPNGTPSQNYYVYYYPEDVRGQTGGATVAADTKSSILAWSGWRDVGAGVVSLALVLAGGTILYKRYGTQVKSRALRELKDVSADDAMRMARTVLQALDKFSNMNSVQE